VATRTECDSAVAGLILKLSEVDPDVRRNYVVERTVSCRVSDLNVTYSGRLCDEGLRDFSTADDGRAQVRLTVDSDDLLALVEGRLGVSTAWAVGRLRVQANPLDLLKLRTFL